MARRGQPDIAKLLAQANALLEKHGAEPLDTVKMDGPSVNYRAEDAVLVFVNHPPHFHPGKCKNCGKVFAVNKNSVGFCSSDCRKEEWRRTMHVPWAAISTHDVWNGDPPMIVTPEQMKVLEGIARWFIQNQTRLEIQPVPNLAPTEYTSNPKDSPVPPGRTVATLPQEDFEDLFSLDEEQTDQMSISPHTNQSEQQSPLVLPQMDEEEPLFDFD